MAANRRDERLGIALCGAELLGTVHIGILAGLERIGIQPDCIAGTSSGAIVAAMHAYGYSHQEFDRVVRRFPGLFLLDYGFPLVSSVTNLIRRPFQDDGKLPVPSGLFRGKRLQRYVENQLRNRKPRKPLFVVATDLFSTDTVVFSNDEELIRRGMCEPFTSPGKEIVGSCAVPGLLSPVRHGKWLLVDGGVREMVPVHILREAGCTKIIAVDLHNLNTNWTPITMADVIARSIFVLLDESTQTTANGADVMLVSPKPLKVSWFNRKPLWKNVQIGSAYVMEHREEILRFVNGASSNDPLLKEPRPRVRPSVECKERETPGRPRIVIGTKQSN